MQRPTETATAETQILDHQDIFTVSTGRLGERKRQLTFGRKNLDLPLAFPKLKGRGNVVVAPSGWLVAGAGGGDLVHCP